ncbi:MAG TPA: sialidase family protein, partial [Candidatus Thermoplasmatota archaeon]|nr:sialidase family protein [Candidatus Thermoplasmatota archaeon]
MRVLAVLLLAALPVLAGCVSPPAAEVTPASTLTGTGTATVGEDGVLHRAGGAVVPAAPDVVRAVGAQFFLGAPSSEPTIGVDPDGVVFMTGFAPGAAIRTPTVFRSADQGMTWESVGAPAHVATLDPYVYVDPATGRVFQDDILPLGCGTISFSDDKGETWTTNPLGCGNPQVNDHQTLVAAKPRRLATLGYENVIYRCVNNVAYPACAVSLNGGVSFLPQRPIVEELGIDPGYSGALGPLCSSLTGHLEAAPDGTVYLPMSDCTVATSPPIVAITQDDGLTWTVSTISEDFPSDEHDVGIAVDEAGNVFALWASEGRLMLARSTDVGATWTPAIDVTAPGVTGVAFTAIAAGAEGRIAFAYVGTNVTDGYEGKEEADDWEDATWNAYIGVITDALVDDPIVQTSTANDPADPVARGVCGRTRCRGMTDFIEIVVDAAGRPWASFVDVCEDACEDEPMKGG